MKKSLKALHEKNKFLGYILIFFVLLIYVATLIKLDP